MTTLNECQGGSMTDPITTALIYPPIPDRRFDWCAYRDAERQPYGYGRTEEEAVNDLLELEADQ